MSIETLERLKALKLYGMAQTWPELLGRHRGHPFEPEAFVRELIAAEGVTTDKNPDSSTPA